MGWRILTKRHDGCGRLDFRPETLKTRALKRIRVVMDLIQPEAINTTNWLVVWLKISIVTALKRVDKNTRCTGGIIKKKQHW